VIALLADVNIQGQVKRLVSLMQAAPWGEFCDYLQLRSLTFKDVGLNSSELDSAVWKRCQELSAYLITNNRNDDGPDSHESTIRAMNSATSLPVFMIGDADRILEDTDYADQVIESLLEYLLYRDDFHGTGRLFLP
jgi:hypothetical protein